MGKEDFRYLGLLLDWCAGQGFCQIDGLQDPDEFAYELGQRLGIQAEDYSADALADAIANEARP